MKSVTQIDPPYIPKLPKQRATVFPQISKRAIAFLGHGVPIDVDPVDTLISQLSALALGTQHGNLVSRLMQGEGLLQDARIEGDRLVLNDNEDFFLHLESLRLTAVGKVQREHRASSPAPSGAWEFC